MVGVNKQLRLELTKLTGAKRGGRKPEPTEREEERENMPDVLDEMSRSMGRIVIDD